MLLVELSRGVVVSMSAYLKLNVKGDFKNLEKFLIRMSNFTARKVLEKYGKMGVEALESATPKDTGKTASSWTYSVEGGEGNWSIVWSNTNVNRGVNIAIILQEGHGTGTGGYVQGRDYINPALRTVFDQFADELWEEVTK